MVKKNNKLINRKVFGVNTKNLIITFLSFCFCFQISFSTDISIWPKEIKFNYDTTAYTYDAINLKKDKDNRVPVPEWINGEQENEKCAYIKGQSNRKIQVKFDSNSDNMNFLIKATVITGEGIGEVCEGFISECDLDENRWITLDLNGSLPNSVGIRTFEWKWEATALPRNAPYYPIECEPCTTTHTYYTLLAAPQDPMDEPWISVLDYACDWASGQTSSSGIAQKLVEGLYNNTEFLYDVVDGSSRYTGEYSTSFNLTVMLSEIGGNEIVVNCYDMGKAVTIFANALGCSSGYVLSDPFGYLNCIKPIGRSWINNPFYEAMYPPYNDLIEGEDDPNRSFFGNHAFCSLVGIFYDATLKVDIDSNPDAPPHNIESWATGWNWTTYKSKVIDNNPAPPYGTGDPYPYSFEVY